MKTQQIEFIYNALISLPKACWGDASDNWGTSKRIALLTSYNWTDVIQWDREKESYMNELSNMHTFMQFIFDNIDSFNTDTRHVINSPYDCTGQCCSSSVEVKQLDDYSLIIIMTDHFDL